MKKVERSFGPETEKSSNMKMLSKVKRLSTFKWLRELTRTTGTNRFEVCWSLEVRGENLTLYQEQHFCTHVRKNRTSSRRKKFRNILLGSSTKSGAPTIVGRHQGRHCVHFTPVNPMGAES